MAGPHPDDRQAVEIELCGCLADEAGPTLVIPLPAGGASAEEVLALAARAVPSLAAPIAAGRVRLCIGEVMAGPAARVGAGDRIALFPPVSGG